MTQDETGAFTAGGKRRALSTSANWCRGHQRNCNPPRPRPSPSGSSTTSSVQPTPATPFAGERVLPYPPATLSSSPPLAPEPPFPFANGRRSSYGFHRPLLPRRPTPCDPGGLRATGIPLESTLLAPRPPFSPTLSLSPYALSCVSSGISQAVTPMRTGGGAAVCGRALSPAPSADVVRGGSRPMENRCTC